MPWIFLVMFSLHLFSTLVWLRYGAITHVLWHRSLHISHSSSGNLSQLYMTETYCVNKHGVLLSNFYQFAKLILKAQINSLKSPINSYHFFSPFPPYKLGFPSCIYISTGTRLSPLQFIKYIQDRSSNGSGHLQMCWNVVLVYSDSPWWIPDPTEFTQKLILNGNKFHISNTLLCCWPFMIFHSLPHHSNSIPQIQFIFPQFNSLVWHIFPSIPVTCHFILYIGGSLL